MELHVVAAWKKPSHLVVVTVLVSRGHVALVVSITRTHNRSRRRGSNDEAARPLPRHRER